jgi:hypothetical protein
MPKRLFAPLISAAALSMICCVFATLGSYQIASGSVVPRCTTSSSLSAKFIGPNGAAGLFYFLIAVTNAGSTECVLAGVPHAQAVEGTNEVPVGPAALYLPTPGVINRRVVLAARGGKGYVEYYIRNAAIWTIRQCGARDARGVMLRPLGTKSFYIPINRKGATEVCTKLSSTAVGVISAKSY